MQNIVPWPYQLRAGHSKNPAEGACIMDAINWLMHGRHGDHPLCVDPIFVPFCTTGNDSMPDDIRQKFLLRAHLLAGSIDPETRDARLRIIILGAVRIFLPMALDAAALCDEAKTLRDLPDDISYEEMKQAAAKASLAAKAVVETATTNAGAWAVVAATDAEAAASWATTNAGTTGAWAGSAARATSLALRSVAPVEIVWDKYFEVLDEALNAGKTGEQWSATQIEIAVSKYKKAIHA